MSAHANNILEMLSEDIVSHGLLAQCLQQSEVRSATPDDNVKSVLTELLASGNVEVGEAKLASPEHVEFIAWKGTVEERVERALAAVDAAKGPDREFAYWLCLRRNIDRVEK